MFFRFKWNCYAALFTHNVLKPRSIFLKWEEKIFFMNDVIYLFWNTIDNVLDFRRMYMVNWIEVKRVKMYVCWITIKFENNFYSFCVLPFGFCLGPFFHAKILKPVTTFLRDQGVRLNLYVDDFLILAECSKFRDHTD